jgi:hypothetical protein
MGAGLAAGLAGPLLVACGGGGGGPRPGFISDPPSGGAVTRIGRLAGNGTAAAAGDGGAALAAQLGTGGLAVDGLGNIFIADAANHRVRMIAAVSGTLFGVAAVAGNIYTVAGTGLAGFSGDGGAAALAQLHLPADVAIDAVGNLLVADSGNHRVRMVARSSGQIATLAGAGAPGYAGDAGAAAFALLRAPGGLAVDVAGNVLIADTGNHAVRVVAASSGGFYGMPMTAGLIYTIAGDGTGAPGFAGDGDLGTVARFDAPLGLAVDAGFNVAIADSNNQRIRLLAGGGGPLFGVLAVAQRIYTVAGNGTFGSAGDGGPANAAQLAGPEGVLFSAGGHLVIADTQAHRVRIVARSAGSEHGVPLTVGQIATVAGTGSTAYSGDGTPAIDAGIGALPTGLGTDAAGRLLVSSGNRLLVIGA